MLLWPVVEAIRILIEPVHEVVYGDFALFEMATRDAWDLDQLVGPSAHPGFHHPGPAMFYLLAPFVRLLEPGPGLYFGTLLINAAALVAVVTFAWRRGGPRAALWTAAVVNLFCLAVDLDTLREPWNSLLIIAPMLLFVVLWAGAVTGVRGTWLWAAAVGSYEIQSHVTTAVFVAVMLVLAAAWSLGGLVRHPAPRTPPGWWRGWSRLTGVGALLVIWVPSTIELFVGRPNNLQLVWSWLRHHGQGSSIQVNDALSIVLRSITSFHSSDPRSPLLGSLTWWSVPVPRSGVHEAAGALVLIAGAVLMTWLARRKQWFATALAFASLLSIPLATFTVTRAGDDNYAFATGWLAFVPYVLLVALGVALLARRPVPPRISQGAATSPPAVVRHRLKSGAVLLCSLALATAAVTAVVDLRERPLASVLREIGRTAPFTSDAVAQLRPGDHWIGIRPVSPAASAVPAGLVVELERRGYRTVVDAQQKSVYGRKRTTPHPVDVLFSIYLTSDPAGAGASPGVPVTTAGDTVMTAWRPNS